MRNILIILTILFSSSSYASTKDLAESVKSVKTLTFERAEQLTNQFVVDNPNYIENSFIVINLIPEPADREAIQNKILSFAKNCKQSAYVDSMYVSTNRLSAIQANEFINDKVQNMRDCSLLNNSDKVYIYSNLLGFKLAYNRLWSSAMYDLEKVALDIRENRVVISARAAANMYFKIAVVGKEFCEKLSLADCAILEQYFVNLKLAQKRLMFESTDYFDNQVLYLSQLNEISSLDNKRMETYFLDDFSFNRN